MNPKKVTDYTDRELQEKTALFVKAIAENTAVIKIYLIVMTVLIVLCSLIVFSNLK